MEITSKNPSCLVTSELVPLTRFFSLNPTHNQFSFTSQIDAMRILPMTYFMQLSCIDCGEIFGRDTVQDHTQCITEAVRLTFSLSS